MAKSHYVERQSTRNCLASFPELNHPATTLWNIYLLLEKSGLMVLAGCLNLGLLHSVHTYPCGRHLPLTCPLENHADSTFAFHHFVHPVQMASFYMLRQALPCGFLSLNHQIRVMPSVCCQSLLQTIDFIILPLK